jgi:uncharacterized membrane protein
MLVSVPIGLWVFSFVCDLVFLATKSPAWSTTAYFAVGGGVIGAVLAAVPGLIDGLFLRKSPIFRIVLLHLALNVFTTFMFVMSFLSRSIEAPYSWSLLLSVLGLVPLGFAGWIGGKLVFVEGMGVEPQPEGRHGWQGSYRRSSDVRRTA